MSKIVAIIGGGPIGLAAAAHAIERNLRPIVFEAGGRVGHTVRAWQHVGMFSSWELNVDRAARHLLESAGWLAPDPADYPTGLEFCERYIEPLARVPSLQRSIRLETRVTAITRIGSDKLADRSAVSFNVAFEAADGSEGWLAADAVIDCSGNWAQPRPAGAGGIPALGEARAHSRLRYGPVDVLGTERGRYARKRVAVLGNRHSAICTLIDLARLAAEEPGTRPIWLVRGSTARNELNGGVPRQLAALEKMMREIQYLTTTNEIELITDFPIEAIDITDAALSLHTANEKKTLMADELIVTTGFRPNLELLRELRLSLDPTLECPAAIGPLIDPTVHTARTARPHGATELGHPEPEFFIAGIKSYGRAATFLLITGYEQVRSIVAHISGDHDAASRVELSLPW